MADPTVATEKGYKEPAGGRHKCYHYALTPGKAWMIDDVTRDHTLVEVDAKLCKQAKYEFNLRWIDGRTVAEFEVGDKRYAQPIKEDDRPKKRKAAQGGRARDDRAGPLLDEASRDEDAGGRRRGRAQLSPQRAASDDEGGRGHARVDARPSKRAAPEANSPKPKRASKKNPPDLL